LSFRLRHIAAIDKAIALWECTRTFGRISQYSCLSHNQLLCGMW